MKMTNVVGLWASAVALVVVVGCGKQKSKGDQGAGAVAPSSELGSSPCGNGLASGPQGQEPVPVFPNPGQPGYQPVPPSPGGQPNAQQGPASQGQNPGSAVYPVPAGIKPDCKPGEQKPGGTVIVVPGGSGGYPGQTPGQTPCQSGCGGAVKPTCNSGCGGKYAPPGTIPEPIPLPQGPGQVPSSECGKPGKVCFPGKGGPVQYPGQAEGGAGYNQGEVAACLGAMSGRGVQPQGVWGLQVTELKAVSVLGSNRFIDSSVGPRIVLIKATSVLGQTDFILGNPQALYCIKSVSVLEDVHFASCWSNNVIIVKDVNILSSTEIVPLQCH